MIGGSAGDDIDAVDVIQLLKREAEPIDVDAAGGTQTPDKRVANDARLLVDLLEHEVRIARLLCHVDVPVDVSDLRLNRGTRLVGKGDSPRSELRELAILENDDVASRIDEGNHVRGHVRAGLATADNDG